MLIEDRAIAFDQPLDRLDEAGVAADAHRVDHSDSQVRTLTSYFVERIDDLIRPHADPDRLARQDLTTGPPARARDLHSLNRECSRVRGLSTWIPRLVTSTREGTRDMITLTRITDASTLSRKTVPRRLDRIRRLVALTTRVACFVSLIATSGS